MPPPSTRSLLTGPIIATLAAFAVSKVKLAPQQVLAHTVAKAPGLILADEHTAALDSELGRQVMEFFAKIGHEHKDGVIVVNHDHRTLDVFDRIHHGEDDRIQVRPKPKPAPTAP